MSMNSLTRTRIQRELRVKPSIDPPGEIRGRVAFLADYLRASGTAGFVLGISGGQDSTQVDEADAVIALDFIDPDRTVTVDIRDAVDSSARSVATALGVERIDDFVRGNVKARQRMIVQYAIAGQENLLVVGSVHAAEAVTGF